MSESNGLLESLRIFRRDFHESIQADPKEITADEEAEEPFLDDKDEGDPNVSELFERFELSEPDRSIFGQSALDRLDSIIPDRSNAAETFEAFFAGLEITHFKAHELLRMGGQNASGPCEGKNKIPDKSLWPNIALTIKALDMVRENLGYAINTTSVYRHEDYNECLRERDPEVAEFSQHLRFRAIDFQGVSGSPTEWHSAVLSIKALHPEFGIWTRKYRRFVHIDTRFAS